MQHSNSQQALISGSRDQRASLMSAAGGPNHNVAASNSSFKKTGVCVSKCYQMLCGRCGRRFAKIMILELTADTEAHTAFEIQAYFNSTQSKSLHPFISSVLSPSICFF